MIALLLAFADDTPQLSDEEIDRQVAECERALATAEREQQTTQS